MKKVSWLSLSLMLLCIGGAATTARAQGGLKSGPDSTVLRDTALEQESLHNLEVARHYFKLKKAYKAAVTRCEEIIAGNPTFSRLDEVLYIAGASSLRMSENRGKQKTTTPVDKLREDAREYLSRVVSEYPDSEFRERAENDLAPLGGVKKNEKP